MLVLFSLAVHVLFAVSHLVAQTAAPLHRFIQRHLSLDAIAPAWFGRDFVLSPISVWSLV